MPREGEDSLQTALPDAFAHRPESRRDNRTRIFGGLVALALHGLLIAGLILTLNTKVPLPVQTVVRVDLIRTQPRPPVKLTIQPKLIAPKETQIELPHFDITPTPAPVALTSTAQGLMPSQPGGAGNGGMDAPKPAPPAAPLPGCETREAFLARVRAAIMRYQTYPQNARLKHLEGVVTLHFIADKDGHLSAYAIAASTITSTLYTPDSEGHQQPVVITFVKIGATQWSYDAKYAGPPANAASDPAPLGQGTVSFDAGGKPTEINGGPPGSGKITITIPRSAPGQPNHFISVDFGSIDVAMLNDETLKTIQEAAPLPSIPDCLNLPHLNAVMPFGYQLERQTAQSR